MKIGILSDSHDNIHNLIEAVEYLKENHITTALHLGDFCAPTTVLRMLESSGEIVWYCVWGNVDGDKVKVLQLVDNTNFDIVAENFRSIVVDGQKIFMSHYPEVAQVASESGSFDAVFYGHDHIKSFKRFENGSILANPGEIVGYKTRNASFAVWDTTDSLFEHIDIKNPIIAV